MKQAHKYDQVDFEAEVLQDMQDHLRISHDLKRLLSKSEPPLVRKFKEKTDAAPKHKKPQRRSKIH